MTENLLHNVRLVCLAWFSDEMRCDQHRGVCTNELILQHAQQDRSAVNDNVLAEQ